MLEQPRPIPGVTLVARRRCSLPYSCVAYGPIGLADMGVVHRRFRLLDPILALNQGFLSGGTHRRISPRYADTPLM